MPEAAVAENRFELFAHDADIGIRGIGETLERAFEQGALALLAIVTDAPVVPARNITVTCEAANRELLFVAWLNAIIYQMAVTGMLFARCAVTIEDSCLRADLWGEPLDSARHKPACEPKGATLTMLRVAQEQGHWIAQCIVDV